MFPLRPDLPSIVATKLQAFEAKRMPQNNKVRIDRK
jgi:hypothetical protein